MNSLSEQQTDVEQKRLTNIDLYNRQVELLKTFLSNHAITQAQYDKSYGDLTAKMFPENQNNQKRVNTGLNK